MGSLQQVGQSRKKRKTGVPTPETSQIKGRPDDWTTFLYTAKRFDPNLKEPTRFITRWSGKILADAEPREIKVETEGARKKRYTPRMNYPPFWNLEFGQIFGNLSFNPDFLVQSRCCAAIKYHACPYDLTVLALGIGNTKGHSLLHTGQS